METMQPILTDTIKNTAEYLYEVKYDGFRAILNWNKKTIRLKSRKNTDLTAQFPEIIRACLEMQSFVEEFLPLQLDGELVILNNYYQANFSLIQKRGRMRSQERIDEEAARRPASFLAFDLLEWKGKDTKKEQLLQRKSLLDELFQKVSCPQLQLIASVSSYPTISKTVWEYMAEGIVAKQKNAIYTPGKQHHNWLKEKNWRTIHAFLTAYNPSNGYFELGVFDAENVQTIGHCKHGLAEQDKQILLEAIAKTNPDNTAIPPAICAAIHTLEMQKNDLREPSFVQLRPEMDPAECTIAKMHQDLAMLPDTIDYSNQEKPYWPEAGLAKIDLLLYMRKVYPYMSPYMKNRTLTVIRCPEGVNEECFFQKHLPSYSPEFMQRTDEKIVADQLEAFLWLANHGGVEYHIPFEQLGNPHPDQIVFDLDPPSVEAFAMAVETALLFKQVFDELDLITFIKTSGGKGLQIHLPLPVDTFTYDETANFTENMANIIVEAAPHLCTIERLKKNRHGKLYIDYVQHGKKKTIIAPYSPRKTATATIATPLDWKEVNDALSPDQFTIATVLKRIKQNGCPWYFEYEQARSQSFKKAAPLFLE